MHFAKSCREIALSRSLRKRANWFAEAGSEAQRGNSEIRRHWVFLHDEFPRTLQDTCPKHVSTNWLKTSFCIHSTPTLAASSFVRKLSAKQFKKKKSQQSLLGNSGEGWISATDANSMELNQLLPILQLGCQKMTASLVANEVPALLRRMSWDPVLCPASAMRRCNPFLTKSAADSTMFCHPGHKAKTGFWSCTFRDGWWCPPWKSHLSPVRPPFCPAHTKQVSCAPFLPFSPQREKQRAVVSHGSRRRDLGLGLLHA